MAIGIGTPGNDLLFGNAQTDHLIGGGGADILIGGNGGDSLEGDTSTFILDNEPNLSGRTAGQPGPDLLVGGAGADCLYGGPGDDRLVGGEGADVFTEIPGGGTDTIYDFTPGEDRLWLSSPEIADFSRLDANGDGVLNSQDGIVSVADGATTLDLSGLGGPGAVILIGVTDPLTASDFAFGPAVEF